MYNGFVDNSFPKPSPQTLSTIFIFKIITERNMNINLLVRQLIVNLIFRSTEKMETKYALRLKVNNYNNDYN